MSRIPENDNIRNDIYENLPCQAMYNESVRKIKLSNEHNNTSNNIVLNNCNQNSGNNCSSSSSSNNNNRKTNLPKELLYATPLRKSDRYNKSGDRHRNKINTEGIEKCEKLHNVEYKLMNKDNIHLKNGNSRGNRNGTNGCSGDGGDDAIEKLSSSLGGIIGATGAIGGGLPSSSGSGLMKNCTQGNNLEDRRILNFLKDTTQVQKKIEIGKDCPNASFSCLAREEHFANLVQQNFTINLTNTTNNCSDIVTPLSSSHPNSSGCVGVDNGKVASNKNNSRTTTEETVENLEVYMDKKQSPDKEVNGIVYSSSTTNYTVRTNNVCINREWVLKKLHFV